MWFLVWESMWLNLQHQILGVCGYLEERGMIPMPDEERAKFGADAKNMTALAKR